MSNKVKTIKEVLLAMKDLYQNKLEWCKGNFYQDKFGNPIDCDGDIHSVCLLGCLTLAVPTDTILFNNIVEKLKETVGRTILSRYDPWDCGIRLSIYNDKQALSKNDILNLIQKAIDSCQE